MAHGGARSGQAHDQAPSAWVVRFAHLVKAGASVLDLASGAGRHARYFASRGCEVLAVDRDAGVVAPLRAARAITVLVADLEGGPWPFGGRRFDAIVATNYLHRPLLPQLGAALASDGVLLYETFAAGNGAFGRPSNPAFLLEPGELAAQFAPLLTIVAFEQGTIHAADRMVVVQRLAAVGRGRAWPPVLTPAPGSPPE